MKKNPTRILVVASSPPPYGGQAMMVQTLLDAKFDDVELHHVRMAFSSSMKSMGKFELKKLFHMFDVVGRAMVKRFKYSTELLYYVPGGSGKAPVLRDIFILFFLKLMCRKVIFHFHAAGVSEVVETLPSAFKKLAFKQYALPDFAIFLSGRNPDADYFRPKQSMIIPNGLQDEANDYLPLERKNNGTVKILFVGVLKASKGVKILLEATKNLLDKGYNINTKLMGEFSDIDFKLEIEQFCKSNNLNAIIEFTGVLIGQPKWEEFAQADIFCFPSYFESESFGNVLVEAMMFQLPIVSTEWRGIPDIVENSRNGFLVPIKNSSVLSERLEQLIKEPELRVQMGKEGRLKYLQKYKLDAFVNNVQIAFDKAISTS